MVVRTTPNAGMKRTITSSSASLATSASASGDFHDTSVELLLGSTSSP